MRTPLLLAAGGCLFAALPYAPRGGLVTGTVLPVAFAIAFAAAAAGRISGVALAAGAVSALLGQVAWLVAPALGGAIVVALSYAERSLRVRQVRMRGAHVAIAVVSGACAGTLAAAYASSALSDHAVAVGLCAVLAAAPLLVPADDPRAVLLESAARTLGLPLSLSLVEGAELVRCADPGLLDRETANNVKKSWRSLERLVEARLQLHGGGGLATRQGDTAALVVSMVDKQIVEHITSLTRAYTAATTKGAAELGLDDAALRGVHARGEALDEQSRAIVEVKAG